MEPNNPNFAPPQELPTPVEAASTQLEQAPAAPETGANKQQTAAPKPTPTPSSLPLTAPHGVKPLDPAATNSSVASDNTLIADDADLIEKEWVVKAKAIVAQTKDDPYAQNQSMTRVKADYLKKRYNKDLKVSEG